MKVAMSWFSDYVDVSDITPEEFAEAMTMSGSKVEGIQRLGEGIENVVTGKILSVTKHENADSLQVCIVDVGGEELQIVTGANNVRPGQIVPVAKHDARLAGGIKIKKSKLRGVESEGMLCSHEELGLTEADLGFEPEYGILILDKGTPIGADIRDALGLNDSIFEFEITSNRPDCLSVIGLAREAAVTFGRAFKLPAPEAKGNADNISDFAKVDVLDQKYCPRYSARMIKNVKIAPSPAWLSRRLQASGIRSINNIVDITNYILLEYGQPMHAFDMRDLAGGHIIVRRAKDGEMITTLDDQPRKLDSSMLVIADEEKPVAVAGVMGAQNSEVKDDTKVVLFECANFDAASVRLTARKLGLRTESSARYEKGIDPYLTEAAVNRACELVEMLGAGEVVGGMIDVQADLPKPRTLKLRPEKINRFLGADIDAGFMVKTLKGLGFGVDEDSMTVQVPSYRADVEKNEADIAEEIARFYGYDNIKSTLMSGRIAGGGKTTKQQFEDRIKNILASQGLYEIKTYTFTSPAIFDKLHFPEDSPKREVVRIINPLGEENSVMRTTTLASMLEVLARNFNRRNEQARLFEIGRIYIPKSGQELPDETDIITLGMYGGVDFYNIKGVLEEMFDRLGIKEYSFTPEKDNATYHPGRCAKITIGAKTAGYVGQVHPQVASEFEIEQECYLAEVSFDLVCAAASLKRTYKKLPKYPSVSRDLALLADDKVLAGDITRIIQKFAGNILDSIELFDVYQGPQIPAGKKSMAYSVTFRADDRTLTDAEINSVLDKILNNLQKDLGVQLR